MRKKSQKSGWRIPRHAVAQSLESRTLLSTGLTAQYFSSDTGIGLTGYLPSLSGVAANVNFSSGANTFPSGSSTNFSARYEGHIKPTVTGTYTFYADVVGGVHLFLAPIPTGSAATSQELINDWTNHSTEDTSLTVNLTSGTSYAIKVEYISYTGTASAVIQWAATAAGVAKAPIPSSVFTALDAAQSTYTATAVDTTTHTPIAVIGAPGWSHMDLGPASEIHATGVSNYSAGVFTISGDDQVLTTGPYGITNDAIQYAYQQVTGDFTFTARITSMIDPSASTDGLMMRTGLTASVPSMFLYSNGAGLPGDLRRQTAGAAATNETFQSIIQVFPYWMQIVRYGNDVVTYYAPDNGGVPGTWVYRMGAGFDNLPATVDVGLAATSRPTSSASTATFDNVTVSPLVRDHSTSEIGNSFVGGEQHIINSPIAAYLDPYTGQFIFNGTDEDKGLGTLNSDGSFGNFGNNSHYLGGDAVTADANLIYAAQIGGYTYDMNGVQPYDNFGIAQRTAIMGNDTVNGLAVIGSTLYIATDGMVYGFNTSTLAFNGSEWEVPRAGNMAADPWGNLWIIQNADSTGDAAQVAHYSVTGSLLGIITFPAATFSNQTVIPQGIAVDQRAGFTQGQVYVTDVGNLQQIHIFSDVSDAGSGTFTGNFGDDYGVYGGTCPGTEGPTKLQYPVGVGIDSAGNIYVAGAAPPQTTVHDFGSGGIIEKFSSVGTLLWEEYGLEYVDTADPDPASPTDVYTKLYHYTVNYNQNQASPGSGSTLVGTLVNPQLYPTDPRLVGSSDLVSLKGGVASESPRAGVVVREIDGVKFLYDFDQHASAVNVYRFLPNSQTTVFTVELQHQIDRYNSSDDGFYIWTDLNGDGVKETGEEAISQGKELGGGGREAIDWYVDANGNIWTADGADGTYAPSDNILREYKVTLGNASNGAVIPIYSESDMTQWKAPAQFTELTRAMYDPTTDSLYLSGYTTADPRGSTDISGGTAGTQLLKFPNWLATNGTSTASWTVTLPYVPATTSSDTVAGMDIESLDIAGGYVFGVYGLNNTKGVVVWSAATGALMTTLASGAEIAGGTTNGSDIRNSLTATELSNGDYVLFNEEVNEAKVSMFQWFPGQTFPAEGWTSQDIGTTAGAGSAVFNELAGPSNATWTVTATGLNIPGKSDQFHLTSQSFSGDGMIIADVNSLTGGNTLAQAGVIFRDSNAANAMYVDTVFEPDDGNGAIVFSWRSTTGANANSTTYLFPTPTSSAYVELVRQGNSFTGYFSTDGINWTQAGSVQNILINQTALAGLAVSSQQSTGLATATFSSVHLSSGLSNTDIGSPAKPGSTVFNDYNSTWNISGGGADIGGTSDQFSLASIAHIGDGTIIATVDSLANSTTTINASSKAGLMFRAGTAATDYNATIFVTPSTGVEFQYRNSSGGSSNTSIAALATPIWLELVRAGNSFSGFYSIDDATWIQVGSTVAIAMGTSVQAGLAVTSHDNTSLVTAVFGNVSITGAAAAITPTITPDTVGTVSLPSGSELTVAPPDTHLDRSVLIANSISIATASQLGLTGNDAIIHNTAIGVVEGFLSSGFAAGHWNGSTGILSSAAAANISHLTALGYMTGGSFFDGVATISTDVLIKYTYYGDANLDGKVDASDYSLIDSGFATHATGWQNGDFNYDGVVNGSDYTLIDNAFNTQNAGVLAEVAKPANFFVTTITDNERKKKTRLMTTAETARFLFSVFSV